MTGNMWMILEVLATADKPMYPNQIGFAIGVQPRPGGQYRSRGPGSIIAGAITALERRGFVQHARRPDGLSGSAYRITTDGLTALEQR